MATLMWVYLTLAWVCPTLAGVCPTLARESPTLMWECPTPTWAYQIPDAKMAARSASRALSVLPTNTCKNPHEFREKEVVLDSWQKR